MGWARKIRGMEVKYIHLQNFIGNREEQRALVKLWPKCHERIKLDLKEKKTGHERPREVWYLMIV